MYTDKDIIDRLLESDYPNNEQLLNSVLDKIKSFGPEALKMFNNWMQCGRIAKFEIAGISSDYLRNTHNMKDVALIIAYDWLQKEPEIASRLLRKPIVIFDNSKK